MQRVNLDEQDRETWVIEDSMLMVQHNEQPGIVWCGQQIRYPNTSRYGVSKPFPVMDMPDNRQAEVIVDWLDHLATQPDTLTLRPPEYHPFRLGLRPSTNGGYEMVLTDGIHTAAATWSWYLSKPALHVWRQFLMGWQQRNVGAMLPLTDALTNIPDTGRILLPPSGNADTLAQSLLRPRQ